jgi:NAD-dependent deacetylase
MPQQSDVDQQIETIANWIAESEHLIAFTGAGISTDSGIPDFRGPDGVWTRRDKGLPAPRWRVAAGEIKPNRSHLALAELDRLGKLKFLITQNTDNLHRASGVHPDRIVELHGNGQLTRCLKCDTQFTRTELPWDTRRWGPGYRTDTPVPGQLKCPACGGRLISSVVNFGDSVPPKEMQLGAEHAERCDVMLVLGSSLIVNPAASLVGLAVHSGARVVLINQGETPYDDVVTMRLWTGIGAFIPPAVERAKGLIARWRASPIAGPFVTPVPVATHPSIGIRRQSRFYAHVADCFFQRGVNTELRGSYL